MVVIKSFMMQMLSVKKIVIIDDLLHQATNEKRFESQALQEPKKDERKVERNIWIRNSQCVLSNMVYNF